MSDSIFDKIQIDAFRAGMTPRTKAAAKWFMDSLKGMKDVNRTKLLKDSRLTKVNKPLVGSLMMFFYDPKHRKTLPYYDAFPLVLMVEPTKDGFYGLNLHYLPPKLRAILFDSLLEATNNKRYDESTRFKVSYQMLKSISKMKYFRPCFKRYLTAQINSKIVLVEPPEWEIATFLPTQQFQKASQSKVWAESRKNS
jgi:hypothetical protein